MKSHICKPFQLTNLCLHLRQFTAKSQYEHMLLNHPFYYTGASQLMIVRLAIFQLCDGAKAITKQMKLKIIIPHEGGKSVTCLLIQ